MYIAILGRQPSLGMTELERLFKNVSWASKTSALFDADSVDVTRLGGSQKIGEVIADLPYNDWKKVSQKIVQYYSQVWQGREGKITLGISAYDFRLSGRDVQKTGLVLKSKLKAGGISLRLVPNTEAELNTATSHHNKLGLSDNKVELLVVRTSKGRTIIAESLGAQNITAYARRDQGRPKRDAFVGMLPPKLAQMMINYGTGKLDTTEGKTILDPFCGTGVILQEAALLGFNVYGSDLVDKMIDYTEANLEWLASTHHVKPQLKLQVGDAMTADWQAPIDAVVCETYLGQPFSAPPSPSKLIEVQGNCNNIISRFLSNIGNQLQTGTPLCIAIPAWKSKNGDFTHLPLIGNLERLGYKRQSLVNVDWRDLLYYREDQVVARELLILEKI